MILGIGTINLDHIIDCRHLPAPKETITVKGVTLMLGGKGANQIVAAARLGAENMFIGMLGADDANNTILLNDLDWAGVNTKYIGKVPGYSGCAYVMVEESGQNAIAVNLGSNAYITPAVIDENIECFEKADICMTEFAVPMETCIYAMKKAKELGKVTVVNPAPYEPFPDEFYQYMDYVTPNEVEAADYCGFAITDEASAEKAAAFFHSKGVKNVVITMGSQGAYVSDGEKGLMIPCYKVDAIDTSGAGDCFNGAFVYALSKGKDVFEAAQFGNAAASVSVQRKGTCRSMPALEEVEKIFPL